MVKNSTTLMAGALFSILAITVGCGDSGVPTYPVSGTVTGSDGSPVEGAAVSFVADGDGAADAVGVTDASGKYTLTTKGKKGAQVGSYKVTIAKYIGGADQDVATEVPDLEDVLDVTDEYPEGEEPQDRDGDAASKNELPEKYGSAATSGLTATVADSGDNSFDFKLE